MPQSRIFAVFVGCKNSPCEATFLGVNTELKNWLIYTCGCPQGYEGGDVLRTHVHIIDFNSVRLDYSEVVYNTIIDETFSFLILHIIGANA